MIMINIIIISAFIVALICSVIGSIKTKDEDAKMCWILSGIFWFILTITHTLMVVCS